VKFAAIAGWAESEEFGIEFMCRELGVSRSGYYAWRGRGVSNRECEDSVLTTLIRAIHDTLRGNPGVRRVHAGLVVAGQGPTDPVEDPESVRRWVRPRPEALTYILSVRRR